MSSQKELTELYNKCIQNENDLWLNFSYFFDNIQNENVIKALVDNVLKTIKDSKVKAIQKYYSLQLLKACIGTKQAVKLAEYTAKTLLPTLAEFAKHNKGSNDPKRGQNIFGAGQDKDASNDFYLLTIESIKAWSLIFPSVEQFKKSYNSLTKEGVVFPKEMLNYQMELQDFGITPNSGVPSSNNLQSSQMPQQNYQQTPEPAIDPQTEQQIMKLSKFLSNIDLNLKTIDDSDPSQLDYQGFEQCVGPLQRQLSKITEPLIEQVLQLPQNKVTEQLQKKMLEVKELLETIVKEYERVRNKPNLQAQTVSSLRSQISIYLNSNGDGGSQIKLQQSQQKQPQYNTQQFGFNQQTESLSGKKNQSNFNEFNQFGGQQQASAFDNPGGFNNFQFNNFNAAPQSINSQQQFGQDAGKDVFTEFGGFNASDNQPQAKNSFDQFGGFNQQPAQQNQGGNNFGMGDFGFHDQSTANQKQNTQQSIGNEFDHQAQSFNQQNQQDGFSQGYGFGDFSNSQNPQSQQQNMGGFDNHPNAPPNYGFDDQKQNPFDQVFAGVGETHPNNQSKDLSQGFGGNQNQQDTSHDQKQGGQQYGFDAFNQNQFGNQNEADPHSNFGGQYQFDHQNSQQQPQQSGYNNKIDFFQSHDGNNNQQPDNQDTQSQKSQKNAGENTNPQNQYNYNQDQNWGGDYNNYYGNNNAGLDSSKDMARKQSTFSQNSGQGVEKQQSQENKNRSNSQASQMRGGYDPNEFNQPPSAGIQHTQPNENQNYNEYGNYGWNDHHDYQQNNQQGNYDNYGAGGGDTHKNSANNNQDPNQSVNQGQSNQYNHQDYDHYDYNNNNYNYNDHDTSNRQQTQNDFTKTNSQYNNTQNSRRPSQTDFNQSQNNYNYNNDQFGRQDSHFQGNQSQDQKQDSVKDSVYNAGLTDSQYDMVLHRKNSAYQKWKQEQNFYDNPVLGESQAPKESVLQPIDHHYTYDPNMNYDINPTQPDQPSNTQNDFNKSYANNSMNAGNNAPMKYDDLVGGGDQFHQRQPSQQSDHNWGMGPTSSVAPGGGADTASNQGNNRKDSISSNQQYQPQQSNSQNAQADHNQFGFFNDPAPSQKPPSNTKIQNFDFFDGDEYGQAHQEEEKKHPDTASQSGNQVNMNQSYNQHGNNNWDANTFDHQFPDHNNNSQAGGNTATHNANQQNFDFSSGFGFDQKQQSSSQQGNNANPPSQFDFFQDDHGAAQQQSQQNVAEQPKPVIQQTNSHFDAFGDNQQQQPSAPSDNKGWFDDMKQPAQVDDHFFNNISQQSQQQQPQQQQIQQNTQQNQVVPSGQNNVDFLGFETPTPQQPAQQSQMQQSQHQQNGNNQFDFGNFNNQQQQGQNQQNSNYETSWNQPDPHFMGFSDNQNQQQQQQQQNQYQQQQKPQGGAGGNSVDIFDMMDNNPNKQNQQQQQQQQQTFYQQNQPNQGNYDFMFGSESNNQSQPNNMYQNQQQQNQTGMFFGFQQQQQQQGGQQPQLYAQFQQNRDLAQPIRNEQVGEIQPQYQVNNKIVRDSCLQTKNEFDQTRVGIKTYRVLEVSPEIRKRNEEFYQQLSKEEAIKAFMDDQRKELLNKKLIEADADKSSIINKKLEALNMFQLLIIDRQDYIDPLYSAALPKISKSSSKNMLVQQIQSLIDVEQKENSIKEIKELNEHISKLQNEIERRNVDESFLARRIDELEKDLFNTKKNSEKIRKELEGILQEHDKILMTEKESRSENEKLIKEVASLKDDLVKLKNDNSKILNEVIDPEFFRKSFISTSPVKSAVPDGVESGADLDIESKKILNTVRQRYEEYHSVQISRSMREGYKVVEEKTHSANSLEITNKVRNNLDKLLQLNYTSQPNTDDALIKMIGAKSMRQRQREKNKIFFNPQIFREMVDLPIYQKDRDNLDNFKYACLNPKAILYENPFLQIGSISSYEEIKHQNASAVVLQLHFINKTQENLSFTFIFSKSYKTICSGSEVQDSVTIKGKSQKKHTVKAVDFDILQSIPLFNDTARIAIPIALNKFMVFLPIDSMQFRQRWQSFKTTYIYNEPREINERFMKNLSDIKRYFECMIELTNRQRPPRSRYCVAFRIDGVSQFLLKICLVGNSKLVFKVATYDSFTNVAEYLCNYLCFLFTV